MGPERRLFIIDDEPLLLAILKEYFETHELRVFAFDRVPDLEKELKEKAPQAVLLDIIMPQVSGIEVLKKIKKINQNIPVIMMTGYADEEKRLESLRNGAYALLTKPFNNLEELFHTVHNAMAHYIESLKTKELGAEVEERYLREKLSLLELDFLRNLQHMIGETEDPESAILNSHTLIRNFLEFDYFASVLVENDNTVSVKIYPEPVHKKKLKENIENIMFHDGFPRKQPEVSSSAQQYGISDTGTFSELQAQILHSTLTDLSTSEKLYGRLGLFRATPFEVQEEHIFRRFASHIASVLEKIELFRQIKTLSIKDGLTGAYNYRYMINTLENEIERSKRYGLPLSLIILDIDNFKNVNDTYGHLVGDSILKEMTQTIIGTLRTVEIVGRYGGEEFFVILPETDLKNAISAGERLRTAIALEKYVADDIPVKITVSVGIASYHKDISAHDLIKIADDNLYKAKAGGKNRIVYE